MGSEQSSQAPAGQADRDRETGEQQPASVSAVQPAVAELRAGALSPRQGSVCSETDLPYVSYTVNKPIGESPKKSQPNRKKSSSGMRLGGRLGRAGSGRLASSEHNTMVVVNKDRRGQGRLQET